MLLPICPVCNDGIVTDNEKVIHPINKTARKTDQELAELIAVNRSIEFAKRLNLQIHLCHISTRQTLELIHEARTSTNITIEATPHHLFLDNSVYETYGIKAKTNPPLRDKNYNITLDLLKEFDSIGTDHAPHTLEEKQKITWTSAAGIPGLEATLPLLLTEVNNNKLTLDEVVRLTSYNPSKIFKIPNKGLIEVDYDADITVLDMKKEGKIDVDEWFTQGKYTPFENRTYVGCNVMTINRGNIICNENEVIKNENKYVF